MNVQQHIARLESLLARIQRNAGKPRAVSAVAEAEAAPAGDVAPESGPSTDRVDTSDDLATVPPIAAAAPASAERADVEELDMEDDDLVEIAVDESIEEEDLVAIESPLLEAVEVSVVEERRALLANELDEESAPESAPRPAAQLGEEADLEPPVITPPPESGPQVVASPVGITGETELHDSGTVASLEPDLSGGTISQAPAGMPSLSQLGETVELEGADGPAARIELLSPPMNTPVDQEIAADDLELSLPQHQYEGGRYDADLAPPSRATADLARHREEAERAAHPPTEPPVSLASPPSAGAAQRIAPVEILSAPSAASPVVVERPALGAVQVTEMRRSVQAVLPETFLALLDASLAIEA
ncbi:MAG TPA: hypothetical protein VH062_14175 [Polyangiaceae bacterium]|nr:hypothetical protein [Polyangiaceae bacterium]